jgi:hypothetical protein
MNFAGFMDRFLHGGWVFVSVVGILFFSACGKPPKGPDEEAGKQKPSPVEKRLARDGILHVTKRITISTPAGITGVPVGAEVKVIGRVEGEMISVEYQGNRLLIPASQLTNDLNLVDSLGKTAPPAGSSSPSSTTPPSVPDAAIPRLEASIQEAEWRIDALEQELEASLRASSRNNSSETLKNRARQTQIQTLKKQVAAWRNEISFLKR